MKLTLQEIYAAQLKADRRAQAQERRDPAIVADNKRIQEMYSTRS